MELGNGGKILIGNHFEQWGDLNYFQAHLVDRSLRHTTIGFLNYMDFTSLRQRLIAYQTMISLS